MKKTIVRAFLSLLILAIGVGPVIGAPNGSPPGLAGSWRIDIQPDPASGMPPNVNLASFTRDGRVINVDPSVGTAVGEWDKSGGEHGVTSSGFASFGGQTVQYKVRATLTVDPLGDTFSGPFRSTVSDLNGILTFSFEGTVSGTRSLVEPL